jgi:putative heme-binding domain-containing protein
LSFSPAASTPAEDLAALRVLEGFEVSLFASEAEGAVKPIQLRFDPDGRLWLAGSTVYPQLTPGEPADDKITVLEDTDGDGRADRHTVFADGLLIPTGLELGDGGAYVGAATELLHLRDRDGDGRADERRVLFRGFGTGDTHQTLNSFTWGPAGELWLSQGLHARSRVETPWGLVELQQAGLWRLWPRRLKLEAFWSGAMGAHNPFGTVFDRWGQPLVFAGNGHGIYHLTPGLLPTAHFLLQPPLWSDGRKFGGAEPVENAHWPAAHQGEFLAGGYLQNSVERFRITDAGAGFRVERLPPLLESTNPAFRIVDLRFGPDGALHLADWCNPVIGHYQASFRDPARDRTRGRIWRVTARGRPPVAWEKLGAKTDDELAARLASPDRWTRQMAKRVLAGRPAAGALPALARAAAALDASGLPADLRELARVEILGAGAAHEAVETNLLGRLAASERPEARAFAARMAGHWAGRLPAPLELLARLAADPHPRVRLEAVVACGYVPDARAIEVAARVADQPMEPALVYAFTQCVQATRPRWQAAWARGELTFGGRPERQAAFARAEGGEQAAGHAAARLRRVAEVALDEAAVRELAALVAEAAGPADLPALLPARAFTVGTNYLAADHAAVLVAAAAAARRRGVSPGEAAADGLGALLEGPEPAVSAAAARLAGAWRVAALRPRVEALATDEALPAPSRRGFAVRSHALAGVAGYGDAAAVALLRRVAAASPAVPARADALAELAALAPEDAAPLTAALLAAAPAAAEADALVTAWLRRDRGPALLAAAFRAQPPAPAAAEAALAALGRSSRRDAGLAALLTAAAGRSAHGRSASADEIARLAQAVRVAGQPAAGLKVFERPELGCAACHNVGGGPAKVGPDLGALGTAQTVEFILGALLDPQREVKEGFMAAELTLRDGTELQGYVRTETAAELLLLDHLQGGALVRVPAADIARRRQLGSLMPAGLTDALTDDELRDLTAYLARLGRRD